MTGAPKRIVSRDNRGWRECVALAGSARERRRQQRTLLEGIHLCQAWLQWRGGFETLIVSDAALDDAEVGALLRAPATRTWHVTDSLFGELSQLEHGIGVAAIVPTPVTDWPARIDDDCVYLDRLQDPGNVGTILRTCAAVGIGRVALAPGSAACWSPKVLRAGMGAHFALRIHEGVSWAALRAACALTATATALHDARPLFATDLRAPRVWVFGNEGAGVDPAILADGVQRVAIPQQPGIESLNVSSAAAVCLYEQWRQRGDQRPDG
ncbi:MAG: RNA methyltransferase [Burkholderiaceae bacterium]